MQKEVNEGKNFASLRQVYQSLILATWYKKNLKDSILSKGYVDRNKVSGVDVEDKTITQKIYQQYLKAYRKGVYNYIKEEMDPGTSQMIPRKYFSGGFTAENMAMTTATGSQVRLFDQAMFSKIKNILAVGMGIALVAQEGAVPVQNFEFDSTSPHITLTSNVQSTKVVKTDGDTIEVRSKQQTPSTGDHKKVSVVSMARAVVQSPVREYVNIIKARQPGVWPKQLQKTQYLVFLGLGGSAGIVSGDAGGPPPGPPDDPNDPYGFTKGGIDFENVNLISKSDGQGVRTAFNDPKVLNALMSAEGLKAVVNDIQPVSQSMMNILLGFQPNPIVK